MATFNQEVSLEVGLDIAAISTDTTTVGNIIDTAGNEAVDIALVTGTITDGDYVLSLEHGDDSGLSDAAVVAATDLDALVSTVAIAAADDNTAKSIGYVGKKRYVRINVVSTSTSTGGTVGGLIVFGRPHQA